MQNLKKKNKKTQQSLLGSPQNRNVSECIKIWPALRYSLCQNHDQHP